jgi:secreted PhoX family phosphatase
MSTHATFDPEGAAPADSQLIALNAAGRRRVLRGAGSLATGAALRPLLTPLLSPLLTLGSLAGCASTPGQAGDAAAGFKAVPVSTADRLGLASGYSATPLAAWGEPVGIAGTQPAWRPDASNSAADQAAQIGMHHGGLQYLALDGSRRGLLVMNHGGSDDGLLHVRGTLGWSAEKVKKSQAAQGVSVVEVELKGKQWQMLATSRHARRITAATPVVLSGPAAGHALLKTAADTSGRRVLGVLARGSVSITPWGSCLLGEEGFADHFVTADQATLHERRWGLRRNAGVASPRWHEFDERFDTVRHPQEPHRFGWVVEIDPTNAASTPFKRTALGRAAHGGAWAGTTPDGRAVVYTAESGRFEYLYKFVSRDRIRPATSGLSPAQANADLLDTGTLYVARFDADGSGRWLPLVHSQGRLTAANGFADQAEVLVKARQASDTLGGTRMDRPEALAIDVASGWVYAALAHNSQRGAPGQPGADAANPRSANAMGHILQWRESTASGAAQGERFVWKHLLLAGNPQAARPEHQGNIRGDAFACPGALALDPRGVLWIGTGVGSATLGKGEMGALGNNQLLACNPANAEVRRFMTGPVNSELAGTAFTPDGRTAFINVQHPGESAPGPSDPGNPQRYSNWPDFLPDGRPRSATVAVRRNDGGVIGA